MPAFVFDCLNIKSYTTKNTEKHEVKNENLCVLHGKKDFMEFDELSGKVIGCAIEVHKNLGPGLLESAYERCLSYELAAAGLKHTAQKDLPIDYKGININAGYRIDLVIEDGIIVELKSVEKVLPIHEAQLLTYMKLAGIGVGLLINFNVKKLKDGIKRFVL
jgi:GxxExxY protein